MILKIFGGTIAFSKLATPWQSGFWMIESLLPSVPTITKSSPFFSKKIPFINNRFSSSETAKIVCVIISLNSAAGTSKYGTFSVEANSGNLSLAILFSVNLTFLEIGLITTVVSSWLNSISPDGKELRILTNLSQKTVVVPFSWTSTGILVSKLTLISVAFIVRVSSSAINKTFESIEVTFLVAIISCAIAISFIIESLSNVNFIIPP